MSEKRSSNKIKRSVEGSGLRIEPEVIFDDPKLRSMSNPGIEAAKEFVNLLKESAEESPIYPGDFRQATVIDKFLYVGWHEHDRVQEFFRTATRITSKITRAITTKNGKNYRVTITFQLKDGKETSIDTFFGENGELSGGISMSY